MMENSTASLPLLRQPLHLLVLYCFAYGLVFLVGLVGNAFVVMGVLWYPGMRNITNYFILSLAIADLLIIMFCLPATLMNNILTEWWLGNFMCKLSVWVNGTTVCASVYTLVAVTADRYFAICHTMKYSVWEKKYTSIIIIPIWLMSGLLFTPWFIYFQFPDPQTERLLFLLVNFIIAFLIPLIVITVCYTFIFLAIFRHKTIAVDRKAAEREQRIKMRVTNMMLTVIILFAASWLPLYSLFTFLFFTSAEIYTEPFINWLISSVLRPVFQWLSLSNSCINPILYAYFSLKFRRAFREILVLPCRRKYQRVRQFARRTMKRYSQNSHTQYSSFYRNRGAAYRSGLSELSEKPSPPEDSATSSSRRRLMAYNGGKARVIRRKPTAFVQPHANVFVPPSEPESRPPRSRSERLLVPAANGQRARRHRGSSNIVYRSPSHSDNTACPTSPTQPVSVDQISRDTTPFSPPGSSLADSPTFMVHDPRNSLGGADSIVGIHPSFCPNAPLITMRDLDIYSLSPGIPSTCSGGSDLSRGKGLERGEDSGSHPNGNLRSPCHIRFSQITDTTTV